MRFDFASPTRIIFGEGTITEAASLARSFGKHALLVVGAGERVSARMQTEFVKADISFTLFRVEGEPSIETVMAGIRTARSCEAEVVVGCGGGSAIDTAKAIGCLFTNPGELLDYLEVVGKGKQIEKPGLAVIAVPTTAGTGCEVTRNAVLAVPEKKMKVSLRSQYIIPRIAVVDPELTYTLPPPITASTGMDALTQLVEPFVSLRANSMADLFCRAGMERVGRSLLAAYRDGSNSSARLDMSWGSLMGGMALANAGLGAVHGFASPIGGMFSAPHGAVCACLLAPCIEGNIHALKTRGQDNRILDRYKEAARIILGKPTVSTQDFLTWLDEIRLAMHIPTLKEMGISQDVFPAIIESAKTASSMKVNPIVLTTEELYEILERAL